MSGAAPKNDGPLARTPSQQIAADPTRHVWVAASAGTGKTHVLTDRMLRLMLSGSDPDRILALTFTRAAAAEMQNRIVKRLGEWLGYDPARLDQELLALGVPPSDAVRKRARSLFARALDVPGGLKVQTLHAFAQGLLAAFPLEAGLPPGFQALDERDSRQLKRRALAESISNAQAKGDHQFLEDLAYLAVLKGEGGVMQALDRMIAQGEGLLQYQDPQGLVLALHNWLGVEPGLRAGDLTRQYLESGAFNAQRLRDLCAMLLLWNTKTAKDLVDAATYWLALTPDEQAAQIAMVQGVVLTGKMELRSFANAEKKAPGVTELAQQVADELLHLRERELAVKTAEVAARAIRAGHPVVTRYRNLKRAAVAIDYDDMIARTVDLLGPDGRPDYVGWKLDSRYDHVLVDEAQDTNERQWTIIGRLVDEFFTPDPEKDRLRSLFVVGDHKQAIYGFQGTDPKVFEAWRQDFTPRAADSGQPLNVVDLALSFRSGPAILDLVNSFLDHVGAAALGMADRPPPHTPNRAQAPGEVVLWPVVTLDTAESDDAEGEGGPEEAGEDGSEAADRKMAKTLAEQIARWLEPDGAERLWLPAKKRWAQPQDILILLRKRSWLMGALVAELHERQVPVAGVDRLLLTEPLAVLDLLALVRFAVQPEDDLNLACLLVSPFIGWTHEQLRALPKSKSGLWESLGLAAQTDSGASVARAWLLGVLNLADRVGPYAFLDSILSGPLQGRYKLVGRLGEQANDPIDELLSQAQTYEQRNPPALAGFLAWVEAEGSDVKRDAEAQSGQVRLMTIHGSKGLEAPVVVMADSAHSRRANREDHVSVEVLPGVSVPLFHPGKADCPRAVLDIKAELEKVSAEEDLRLLYVGLTRAADHLYIGGALGASAAKRMGGDKDNSWHNLLHPVFLGMEGVQKVASLWDENVPALRVRRGDWASADPAQATADLKPDPARMQVHHVVTSVAPPPVYPTKPLIPSAMPDGPVEGPAAAGLQKAAERGVWIHKLFERLPNVPLDERYEQALGWLEAQGAGAEAEAIYDQVAAILDNPDFADLFGADALAEAPLAGLVGTKAIVGVVDRLLVKNGRVLVVDFKTGLKVPQNLAEIPVAHRKQMAAYTAVLKQAFPDHVVVGGLLYTSAAKLHLLGEKDLAGLLPLE